MPNSSEFKKVILRDFHAKPYSSHLGYQKMLTVMKKFYYWPKYEERLSKVCG